MIKQKIAAKYQQSQPAEVFLKESCSCEFPRVHRKKNYARVLERIRNSITGVFLGTLAKFVRTAFFNSFMSEAVII